MPYHVLWRHLSLLAVLLLLPAVQAQEITVINVMPDALPGVSAAATAVGLPLTAAKPDAPAYPGPVVLWEARGPLSDAVADRLGEFVRQGGSLLLTMSDNPGMGPMRLAFLSPTMGWEASTPNTRRGQMTAAEWDARFFPDPAIKDFSVPWYFEMRPFHASERGQGRYDRYDRPKPYLNYSTPDMNMAKLPAYTYWWSRPLLNRDWQMPLRGDDAGQSPLLVTGRYGAGRVAVFPSSVRTMADTPATRAFWLPVLRWLVARDPLPAGATASEALAAPVVTLQREARSLRVTVQNPSNEKRPVLVLARMLTWEDALIGDVTRPLMLPGRGSATVELPLPKPGPTFYQALQVRDAFDVRLGVLSADGATLLTESRIPVDLRPPVQISVATGEERARTYPFDAPLPGKEARLGLPVMAYAYAPGQEVTAQVTITNGLRNLAPLANVRNITNPDDKTVSALNDEGVLGEKSTDWYADAYGNWVGEKGKANVLEFTFPRPVTLSHVILVGSPDTYRFYSARNPSKAVVEIDGKTVFSDEKLTERFLADVGRVRLPFEPTTGRTVRLRLTGGTQWGIWLGEVELLGTTDTLPPPVASTLTVTLRDALRGTTTPVATRPVQIAAGGYETITLPVPAPPGGPEARFYRLEATFQGQNSAAPLLVLQPAHPLKPLASLHSSTTLDIGFIVTRGFRNVFDTGTGTAEINAGWGQPDDLVWAYARQLKQMGPRTRTQASRLYVTDTDMRHYSTPWRAFGNGEEFYDIGTPAMVAHQQKDRRWKNAETILLSHSDRWDSGPEMGAMHGWQDYEGFDAYLRSLGMPGLTGRTREELGKEIHDQYEGTWEAWHVLRYVHAIRTLREAYAKEGKKLIITSQGITLIPYAYAKEVSETVRGNSDDTTWGLDQESIPLTTGRQMGALAFSPVWAMSTLCQWGYDSAVLCNPQWRGAVGTTEPSRRHLYDRAFRGVIRDDGQYTSMHYYGYNTNAGIAYTMNANDYQEWHRVQERHSLLTPDGPLGAGLVISTARLEDPKNMAIGGPYESGGRLSDIAALRNMVWRLQDVGVSLPFSANAGTLKKWAGTAPLILLNLCSFSDDEIATLQQMAARGVRLVAFKGAEPLSAAAAALFGVHPDGTPAQGTQIGMVEQSPLVAHGSLLLIARAADGLTAAQARAMAPALLATLRQPIDFPRGTAGYGFTSNGRTFILVEDWREEGRVVPIRYRASAGTTALRVIDANDHTPLTARREGDAFVIDVPLRPGDGTLLCLEEVRP